MIRIEGLSKSFGSFYALRDVSLEFSEGEYWMIVGPNGAGKTTLLKIIATLSQPSMGKIEIGNFPGGKDRFGGDRSYIPPGPPSKGGIKELASKEEINRLDSKRETGELKSKGGMNEARTLVGTDEVQLKAGGDRLRIRRQIGFIGHQSFLYDNLTAEENLKFYARMYQLNNAGKRIASTLNRVGLTERKNDLVRTFSRGMIQRLSIGRALLTDPKIILLDEPFSGLDQSAIENFVDLFTSLISPDRIIIMTTHDLHLGLQLAGHFAVLSKGRIVQQGISSTFNTNQFKKLYRKLTEEPN